MSKSGMTPNAEECAQTPLLIPDCEFCGAVGYILSMKRWDGVFPIFLHPECEENLKRLGVIHKNFLGENVIWHRSDIKETARKFFAENSSYRYTGGNG